MSFKIDSVLRSVNTNIRISPFPNIELDTYGPACKEKMSLKKLNLKQSDFIMILHRKKVVTNVCNYCMGSTTVNQRHFANFN